MCEGIIFYFLEAAAARKFGNALKLNGRCDPKTHFHLKWQFLSLKLPAAKTDLGDGRKTLSNGRKMGFCSFARQKFIENHLFTYTTAENV